MNCVTTMTMTILRTEKRVLFLLYPEGLEKMVHYITLLPFSPLEMNGAIG